MFLLNSLFLFQSRRIVTPDSQMRYYIFLKNGIKLNTPLNFIKINFLIFFSFIPKNNSFITFRLKNYLIWQHRIIFFFTKLNLKSDIQMVSRIIFGAKFSNHCILLKRWDLLLFLNLRFFLNLLKLRGNNFFFISSNNILINIVNIFIKRNLIIL